MSNRYKEMSNRYREKMAFLRRVAKAAAALSTCPELRAGAVCYTPDYHVLTTGFNGAPAGLEHCAEVGCDVGVFVNGSKAGSRHLHAETNALLQAARLGVRLEGARMYCLYAPCLKCLKEVVQVGITTLTYSLEAPGSMSYEDMYAFVRQIRHSFSIDAYEEDNYE